VKTYPPREKKRSLPEWFKKPKGARLKPVRSLVDELGLHTVCESAKCPNLGECWTRSTATFMVLGNNCTRRCFFCSVPKATPDPVEHDEPERVATAVRQLDLRHVVITSVDRDDLPDRGAGHFVAIIEAIRATGNRIIEILTPDFRGIADAPAMMADAHPDIFNHNLETAPHLYSRVRPGAVYKGSLELLRRVKELDPTILTKSGLMLGLGESNEQVKQTLLDLRAANVDLITLGQYLRPSDRELPVERYVHPDEFAELAAWGKERGFLDVYAGPFVRSSYNADSVYDRIG
jgi:lipoic acid synthetase